MNTKENEDKLFTFVFLFNADCEHYGIAYGRKCLEDLGFNIKEDIRKLKTRILTGDLIIDSLCREITGCSYGIEKGHQKKSASYHINKQLFLTLIWDLSDAIAYQWNTIDIEDFSLTILSNNIYCITLSHLQMIIMEKIDTNLRTTPGYLGCIQVDLGNPLQRNIFINNLIENYFFDKGILKVKVPFDYSPTIYDWMKTTFDSIESISEFTFNNIVTPFSSNIEISERGHVTQKNIEKKAQLNHRQRVANALFQKSLKELVDKPFSFTAITGDNESPIIPQKKLVNYVLNLDHNNGKNKAKLFKQLLGITSNDWQYLADQLIAGLERNTNIQEVRKTSYGIQYHIDIPIIGKNGISKTVRSAWIAIDDQPIRLTTVYIVSQEEQTGKEGLEPNNNIIKETSNWNELYLLAQKAGKDAIKDYVPIPCVINIPGTQYQTLVKEGKIGSAYVVVKDARKGFGRWARKNDIGCYNEPSGQRIYAEIDSQSKEKAEVYANAFAAILRANGVICSVKSYYD